MLTTLINATVFTGEKMETGKMVIIEDEAIKMVSDTGSVAGEERLIDCEGGFVVPGLIDLQIAGGGGYLFSDDPSEEALQAITDSIVKTGTTGFLIAIPTNSDEVYKKAIETVKRHPHPAVLGLHLEGPFISTKRAGAHSKEYIKVPGIKDIRELLALAGGTVKMITLAPEICSPEVIKLLSENGVTVAAGHSNATYEEAAAGFRSGIKTVTHLFNAMSPLHHRDSGLPGAVFLSEGACASIIADGIHVDYNVVALSKAIMKERLFLVSDAVEECKRGAYIHVRKEDRFTLPDGTLSGSALSMIRAVKNCVEHVNISLEEALRMASEYPARLIGAGDRGQIREGFRADLLVLSKDLSVRNVIINGDIIC